MTETSNDLRLEASVASTPATRCGLCLDDMNEEEVWICPDCQTPIHKVCHDEFSSCITLGCPGQRKPVSHLETLEPAMTIRQVGRWASRGRFFYRCFTASFCVVLVLMAISFLFMAAILPAMLSLSKYGVIDEETLSWLLPQSVMAIGVSGLMFLKGMQGFVASIRDLKEIVRIWRL